jgi:hypothetical protein
LELFDRHRCGEELTDDKLDDLESFKKRRQRMGRYRKEYNEPLDRQDNGKEVNEDRLCFLELIDRRRVGEDLTERELDDLEQFEADEEEEEAAEDASNSSAGSKSAVEKVIPSTANCCSPHRSFLRCCHSIDCRLLQWCPSLLFFSLPLHQLCRLLRHVSFSFSL